ncbi:MAG: S9 family peptidase [Thermoanaerobaculia bacterium]
MLSSKRYPLLSLLTVVSAAVIAGCAPAELEPPGTPVYDAKTFFETTTISGASFSHDENRILMSSDASGTFNSYSQPVAGGQPEQLTLSTTDAIMAVSWFPEDDRFIYTADQGGNELNHLYLQENDGTVKDLTPGENLEARFLGWSRNYDHFWVLTNERDPKFFDLYQYASNGYQRELVYENREGWWPAEVSRDGSWVALEKPRTSADSDIYLIETSSPGVPPRHITPHDGNVNHSVSAFSPDSKKLYYLTDGHGEFTQAWSFDVESGEHAPVIEADWDVWCVFFSESGRYRVSAVNEDARTIVTVLDTAAGQELALPDLLEGDVTEVEFARSESKMAFYVNSDVSPSNLHVLDLTSGEHRKLTESLNPKIAREHLVDGELVRYESFDGLEIPAVLYRPHSASADNPVPALVWVHGGPGEQSRKRYNAIIQHLVNNGYAVVAVNNRGSSGYGKNFYHMDDKKHGDVDLKDCVWARRYLEGLDWIDGSKVGIIGGSYGGYMVAAALTFEPDAFDAGIDIFGITNWLRTLSDIPPSWESFKDSLYDELGDPASEEERLHRISPIFHASNITKPLLVVQGANDPRVLQVESDEIVEAVRKNDVPVEYVIFPDEGHGFKSKANRITASDKYVEFLGTHLKGQEPAERP